MPRFNHRSNQAGAEADPQPDTAGDVHGDAAQTHRDRDRRFHRVRSVSEKLCEGEDDLGDHATRRGRLLARCNLRSRLRSLWTFSFAWVGKTRH